MFWILFYLTELQCIAYHASLLSFRLSLSIHFTCEGDVRIVAFHQVIKSRRYKTGINFVSVSEAKVATSWYKRSIDKMYFRTCYFRLNFSLFLMVFKSNPVLFVGSHNILSIIFCDVPHLSYISTAIRFGHGNININGYVFCCRAMFFLWRNSYKIYSGFSHPSKCFNLRY